MCPGGFSSKKDCIENIAAEVVYGGNEIPFFLSSRSPEVMGGIMLDEFSGIIAKDLTVMDRVLSSFRQIEIILLGPVNNRR